MNNAAMLVVVAVLLVVISLVIWMNVALVRRRRAAQASIEASQQTTSAANEATETAQGPQPRRETAGSDAVQNDVPTSAENTPHHATDAHEPEVVTSGSPSKRTVFGRGGLPYYLNAEETPQFSTQTWMTCFQRLTSEPRVLGWMAFDGNEVGASDHKYDAELVEVLSAYRTTMDSLRREVGMSNVVESSIVGEEGKVWFLTGSDEVWFALFLDKNVDVQEIAQRVLTPAIEGEQA